MPQQTSTFESHFLTHMQDVVGAYHKLIACSWVPILQVGGLGKVRVNCFPKAITTWLGRESNPRPPDPESDALTTLPRCPHIEYASRLVGCIELYSVHVQISYIVFFSPDFKIWAIKTATPVTILRVERQIILTALIERMRRSTILRD